MFGPRFPFRLVWRNLARHPVRLALTVGSLVVAFFLLATLRSLVVTLDAGVRAARSDRLIVQSAVSLFVILPESYEGKIRNVDGVTNVCRWTWFGGYYQEPSNFFAQFATGEETLLDVYPEIRIVEGSEERFLADRRACLVGSGLARDFEWKVGDTVPIISALFPRLDGTAWEFQVAGVYESDSSNVDNRTLFFHHEYLEKSLEEGAAGGPEGVGIYVVKIGKDESPQAVMARIDALFENGPQRVQTTSEAEFQAQFVSMVGNIPFFVSAIGSGIFAALVLAVFNTMLMAAREQVHDVGILKALGFANTTVFGVLLLQSLAVSVLGGGFGVLVALGTSARFADLLGTAFPNYGVSVETVWLGFSLAAVVGLVAGLVPAVRLSRATCIASLRQEV